MLSFFYTDRSFPGYHVGEYPPYAAEAAKLAELIGDNTKYCADHWYTAGYDNPYTLVDRHNEVWFIAK